MDSDELDAVRRELERCNDALRLERGQASTLRRKVGGLVTTLDSYTADDAAKLRGIGVRQRRLDEVERALGYAEQELKIKRGSGHSADRVIHLRNEIIKRFTAAKTYLDQIVKQYEATILGLQNRLTAAERELGNTSRALAEERRSRLLSVGVPEVHILMPLLAGRRKRIYGWECKTCDRTYVDPGEHVAE